MTALTIPIDFDAPPPAVRHSQTSLAAAEAFTEQAKSLKVRVYEWLKEHGPATDEQICAAFADYKDSTPRARRVAMTNGYGGQPILIEDTGETALTRCGRSAVLWRVIP